MVVKCASRSKDERKSPKSENNAGRSTAAESRGAGQLCRFDLLALGAHPPHQPPRSPREVLWSIAPN